MSRTSGPVSRDSCTRTLWVPTVSTTTTSGAPRRRDRERRGAPAKKNGPADEQEARETMTARTELRRNSRTSSAIGLVLVAFAVPASSGSFLLRGRAALACDVVERGGGSLLT